MITPRFDLEQDDEFVLVRITLPHAKLEEGEFDIDGCQFKFHLKPYFLRQDRRPLGRAAPPLRARAPAADRAAGPTRVCRAARRLTFRHALVEDGRERASYDWESRVLTVHLPKAERGLHFGGLQTLAELLAPPKRARLPPKIEVLSSTPAAGADAPAADGADGGGGGGDGSEWEAEQSAEAAAGLDALVGARAGYGFNRAYSRVFAHVPPSEAGMQCPSPDLPGAPGEALLASMRLAHESAAYDDGHYAADLLDEEEEVGGLLAHRPWWVAARQHGAAAGSAGPAEEAPAAPPRLGAEEEEQLRALRPREHLLDEAEAAGPVSAALVDLLYAVCYDERATLGEGSCESAWTVLALSACLSWLARFEAPREACVSCVRRSLAFPLYRHWALSQALLEDVACVLDLGPAAVLRCLLRLRALLQGADGDAHLLNAILVDDTIGWVRQARGAASARGLLRLAHAVRAARVQPSDLPAHFCALGSLELGGQAGGEAQGGSGEASSSEEESDESGGSSDDPSDSEAPPLPQGAPPQLEAAAPMEAVATGGQAQAAVGDACAVPPAGDESLAASMSAQCDVGKGE